MSILYYQLFLCISNNCLPNNFETMTPNIVVSLHRKFFIHIFYQRVFFIFWLNFKYAFSFYTELLKAGKTIFSIIANLLGIHVCIFTFEVQLRRQVAIKNFSPYHGWLAYLSLTMHFYFDFTLHAVDKIIIMPYAKSKQNQMFSNMKQIQLCFLNYICYFIFKLRFSIRSDFHQKVSAKIITSFNYYIILINKMLNRFSHLLFPYIKSLRKFRISIPKSRGVSLSLANFAILSLFMYWTKNKVNLIAAADQRISHRQTADAQQQDFEIFRIPHDLKNRINKHKMILVMDLDQTMVFTRRKKAPAHQNFNKLHLNETIIYVQPRPHIGQFLLAVSQLFTIYVYTAGTKSYADAVINILPNNQVIEKRFYRQSCINHRGNLIKDLKVIRKSFGINGKQKILVLVDDNGLSIKYNHPHSIRVRAFQGDQRDRYLEQIFQHLINYYRMFGDGANS